MTGVYTVTTDSKKYTRRYHRGFLLVSMMAHRYFYVVIRVDYILFIRRVLKGYRHLVGSLMCYGPKGFPHTHANVEIQILFFFCK